VPNPSFRPVVPLVFTYYPVHYTHKIYASTEAFIRADCVSHLLHAANVWNHPAFFDYVDRWMAEDDTQAIAEIKAQSGFDYSADWERQGQTRFWLQGEFPQYTLIDEIWKAYR
jgi:hypothetical protein